MLYQKSKQNTEKNQHNFRACIPFYVLLDKDLSANEIRLYGLIEQMQSSTGIVVYSNRKLSEIIGVSHDSKMIIRMANTLKKKGYIKRTLTKVNIKNEVKELFIWNTCNPIMSPHDMANISPVRKTDNSVLEMNNLGVLEMNNLSVQEVHLSKSHNLKSHNINIIKTKKPKKIIIGDVSTSQKESLNDTSKSKPRLKSQIHIQEVISAYHEILPDLPRIRVVDAQLEGYIKRLCNDWPKYSESGSIFTIEAFRSYLVALREHPELSWLIKPYMTKNGNKKNNSLRTLIRPLTIAKVRNGEFAARQ